MEDYFGNIAGNYGETVALYNNLDDWVFVRNLPKSRGRVLDIGCGTGHLVQLMAKYFQEIYGIDNSPGMARLASQRVKNAKIVCQSANRLPWPDEYFDYVISHTAFHHLEREKAVKEARRVLKKGGRLVILDVVRERDKLKKILKKFFLRSLLTNLRMILAHGLKKAEAAKKYIEGPWSKHVGAEVNLFFNDRQFKEFHSQILPGAHFGTANYLMGYLIWDKK